MRNTALSVNRERSSASGAKPWTPKDAVRYHTKMMYVCLDRGLRNLAEAHALRAHISATLGVVEEPY